MTSLESDFEMHAIWQGYVEEPAPKDFVARKARTIALSKLQGTHFDVIKCESHLGIAQKLSWDKQQSTLFTSLEISWGILTQAVLRSLAGLMSRKKVELEDFCE
jgi:hypothetical protein